MLVESVAFPTMISPDFNDYRLTVFLMNLVIGDWQLAIGN